MTNTIDNPLVLGNDQLAFPFAKDSGYHVELVCQTLQGFGLFRRKEPHGGYSYWTDEHGIPSLVFDEGTSNPLMLFEAMHHLGYGKEMWEMIGASLGYTEKEAQ
jgi:hypothetical protein